MPYLRFACNKRGYENTYVLHTFRRDGRSHPRLLYWFRTPPSVKVGRVPLDADAIRAIEESNPDLSFDWVKMLKVRGRRKTASEIPAPVKSPPPVVAVEAPTVEAVREEMVPQEAVSTEPTPPDVDGGEDEGETEWQHPVVTLMGDEALARIRVRYAEIQVRIAEKFGTPAVGEEIRARAEALNPDRWATIEEAVRGLETFEAETEAIRGVLGRRRPRSRRGGERPAPAPEQQDVDDVKKP